MDPFFKKRNDKMLSQASVSYLEDILRTYKNPFTPPVRNSETYQRALDFREREKQQTTKLKADHERLTRDFASMRSIYDEGLQKNSRLYGELESMRSKYSKLQAERDELASRSSNRSDGIRPVRDDEGKHGGGPSEKHTEPIERTARDTGLQPEVLPTDIPDPGGQGDQHGSEG